MANQGGIVGTFDTYVVRKKDQSELMAKAKGGDETAKLLVWAASRYMKSMLNEFSACGCCDAPFSSGDIPQAIIVLIPTKYDPETVRAHSIAVCSECSQYDDKWLVDQGVRREGLAPTTVRRGDQIH